MTARYQVQVWVEKLEGFIQQSHWMDLRTFDTPEEAEQNRAFALKVFGLEESKARVKEVSSGNP